MPKIHTKAPNEKYNKAPGKLKGTFLEEASSEPAFEGCGSVCPRIKTLWEKGILGNMCAKTGGRKQPGAFWKQ